MATSTINISEFRCRGLKVRSIYQVVSAPSSMTIVQREPNAAQREAELLQEAHISDNPSVFDIGIAREAQRIRHRLVFRPMPIRRQKANVIRFGEPGVTVMQPKGSSGRVQRTSVSHDLPPAA